MIAYAGIGSRTIAASEIAIIRSIARALSRKGAVCYSGNADGSDITFQKNSEGRCVLWLPWRGFNDLEYSGEALDRIAAGESKLGLESVGKYHPNPSALSEGARKMMARNYHQVHGNEKWPMVKLVICCADSVRGAVQGGTGQACRIAADLKIPVVNIRDADWGNRLIEVWNSIQRK